MLQDENLFSWRGGGYTSRFLRHGLTGFTGLGFCRMMIQKH